MTWTQSLARRGVSVQTADPGRSGRCSAWRSSSAVVLAPEDVPFTSLMVPLLLGSILLGPRRLPLFVVFILVLLALALTQQEDPTARTWAAVGIQVLMCLIVLVASWRRSRLGVGLAAGESMFVDLRDRISRQTGLDHLPPGWYAETALESAGGTAFAGDFFVATRPDAHRLEVALVDVSGKGEQAGVRALQLSGAFGGLLGALPPRQFLTAANEYLLRQEWEEGFATAIHLSVDLRDRRLRGAHGRPPARSAAPRRARAAGRCWPARARSWGWSRTRRSWLPRARLRRDDALLLYTDGMVELPRRDIDMGIDRMLGEVERMVRGDLVGVGPAARRHARIARRTTAP